MKRPVLVTVSGMVGTGKSTAVRHIVDIMSRDGTSPAHWRFQRLPCITLRAARARSALNTPSTTPSGRRGEGYQPRALTAVRFLGFLVRIAAFRIFRLWPSAPDLAVSNRYFYDSFAHYDLNTPLGRRYARLIRHLIPKPDVAFLMVASRATVTERRPQYTADYITHVERGYSRLQETFPELIEISSEPKHGGLERVEAVIRERLAR